LNTRYGLPIFLGMASVLLGASDEKLIFINTHTKQSFPIKIKNYTFSYFVNDVMHCRAG
jgi:hypothetical protein